MSTLKNTQSTQPKQFLVLQRISKRQRREDVATDLNELSQLIYTYGGQIAQEVIQRKDVPHARYYIGPGKVDDLIDLLTKDKEKSTHPIKVVIINDLVKPGQLFRLEKKLWKVDPTIQVWDRLDLILNIFDQHASTAESKLQIQLARVSHAGPRIYGLGKTELSRQGGGIGARGKGETNIEFEQRLIKSTQQYITKKLEKRSKQRHQRMLNRKDDGFGPVALVGYTSAGKTTLFNTLTGKDKDMHSKLFTTLDTVVGKMKSPHLDKPILVSDTIGFIRNLPPLLLDSFKSTLLESLESRLILHVIDVSDPERDLKIEVVEQILSELHVTQPVWRVYNKIDKVVQKNEGSLDRGPNDIYISAHTQDGIDALKLKIDSFFAI